MFSKSAGYYDDIYRAVGKDYRKEARLAHRLIQNHLQSVGKRLLDVGCGTGGHSGVLRRWYQVEGLDLDPKMITAARRKFPRIPFHKGDMTDFQLNKRFDAVICLFSSIGYVRTAARLRKAIRTMDRHLLPGGVLLVEPWFSPAQWRDGRVFTTAVNKPGLKIVRMSRSSRTGTLSTVEFQYLIGTARGVEHSIEHHQLGLFTRKEYLDAFRAAGLKVIHDPKGLDGRGLYIGMKPVRAR